MDEANEPPGTRHIDGDEARAGETPRVTRYVLGISLAAVILIFGALLILWA